MLDTLDMSNNKDRTIHRMSDVLASQVAAGEVVERPASVVKELVENSIDANARQIRVEIRRGGISLIKVSDNGSGMSPADAAMCLERHATSKLLTFADLFDIQNLGFRGEALPSIASIAEMRITTRRPQDVEGVVISCRGGNADPPVNAGCAPGTEIAVSNLFFNTPVRRKFLKSEETEAGHIEHQLKLHALAFPEIRFIFVRDGQVVFDVPPTTDLRQRIAAFIGRESAAQLLRIRPVSGPGVRVSGFLMPLSEARRNRRLQFVFLNGRPIEDKLVLRAVRDGYGGIPTGVHPALFLYLEMEPGLVDVNVHPAKREVRFRRSSDLTTAIIDAVAATLSAHARGEPDPASVEVQGGPLILSGAPLEPLPVSGLEPVADPGRPLILRPVLEPQQRELVLPASLSREQSLSQGEVSGGGSSVGEVERGAGGFGEEGSRRGGAICPAGQADVAGRVVLPGGTVIPASVPAGGAGGDPVPGDDSPRFHFIGALAGQYLLYENKEGLVLLSPRAARERIVFERLMDISRRPMPAQRLLEPVLVEMDAREMGTALEVRGKLEQAGFLLSVFGRNTLRVEAVPAMLSLPKVEEFMLELIRSFGAGEARMKRPRCPFEPYAIQIARSYVSREDLRPWLQAPVPLLIDLLRCEIPYCTPSGKPTMVPVTLNELNRKFQIQ